MFYAIIDAQREKKEVFADINRSVPEFKVPLYNFESIEIKLNYSKPSECAYFANSYSDETVLNNSFRILSAV